MLDTIINAYFIKDQNMPETKFERGIYTIAWDAFRANYAALAGLALVLALVDEYFLFTGKSGGAAGTSLFMTTMVNLFAHIFLLNDARAQQSADTNPKFRLPIFRFFWWSFLLGLPATVAAVFFFFAGGGGSAGALLAVLGLIIVLTVSLSLFGTILPVIALGGTVDLRAALVRGKLSFGPTVGWLLIGPGAFWVVLIIGQIVLGTLGVPTSAYNPETGQVSWLGGIVAILVMFAVLFAAILTAAVLCKAYYRGRALIL